MFPAEPPLTRTAPGALLAFGVGVDSMPLGSQ